ncbi:MAG: membrane protein insertase YidC [Bacteroidia bacterium]
MDRNSILGLVLIFLILIGFAYWNQPSEADLKASRAQHDSLLRVKEREDSLNLIEALKEKLNKDSVTKTVDTAALKGSLGSFADFSAGKEEFTILENEELKITFTNKGGRIYSVELKKHHRSDGSPLLLFEGKQNEFGYTFATTENKSINTSELYFTPQKSEGGRSISMKLAIGDNQFIEQKYSFTDNERLIDYKLNISGMEKLFSTNTNSIDLNWITHIPQQEYTYDQELRTTSVHYRYTDDEPSSVSEGKDGKADLKTPVQWVSFKQQYFNSTIIADKAFENGVVETKTDESKRSIKILSANMTVPFAHTAKESFGMKFYFGPNQYNTLTKLNIELERIVPMGWGIFRWVNAYAISHLFFFLSQYVSSFGLIILLLTLIIKTILFPLVYRSYLSTAKMRILKPEIDEIKTKFGDDMTRIQQENMKLYRKAGVNPLGGCIPVALQMPILIAMFQFFPSAFELRQQAFLWAHDLSTYDSVLHLPFNVPGYGDHVSLFALLMTVSSIIFSVYNNQMTGVTGQMKWISYFMPLIFLFMLNSYAAGLNYYYFLSNLVTIGQQLLIKRFVDESSLHAQMQENKKKPVTKSKFQAKLEDIAKKRGVDMNKGKK